MAEFLTPERIGLSRGALAEFLHLPLPPSPTRQFLIEVALELQEYLEYLILFWSEEALSSNRASDQIRAIAARLAEIALLMPRVARRAATLAAARKSLDESDAACAPAPTQPEDRLDELTSMVETAYERVLDACYRASELRNTAERIYFALALAKRLTRDGSSPGFGVDAHTEYALTVARRRIARDSRFVTGMVASTGDIGFGPWESSPAAD
jgi:hypothetical protein